MPRSRARQEGNGLARAERRNEDARPRVGPVLTPGADSERQSLQRALLALRSECHRWPLGSPTYEAMWAAKGAMLARLTEIDPLYGDTTWGLG